MLLPCPKTFHGSGFPMFNTLHYIASILSPIIPLPYIYHHMELWIPKNTCFSNLNVIGQTSYSIWATLPSTPPMPDTILLTVITKHDT